MTERALPSAMLRRDAVRQLLLAMLLLGAVAAGIAATAGFGAGYLLKVLLYYAVAALLVAAAIGGHAPHPRFGPANRITLGRVLAIVLLAALVGQPLPDDPAPLAWAVVVAATCTALADAADGPVARATGMASGFGARFDMEADAALTLVLSALVMQFDKAGAWILAAGLMRYAFVAAARVWPWLAAPLPPSRRRQTVCVVQITALIVCIGPIVPRAASAALAAASLVLLAYSFAVDVRRLARRRVRTPGGNAR